MQIRPGLMRGFARSVGMNDPSTAVVREKLGKIWWLCDDASELTDEIVAIKILVHEDMALMEQVVDSEGG